MLHIGFRFVCLVKPLEMSSHNAKQTTKTAKTYQKLYRMQGRDVMHSISTGSKQEDWAFKLPRTVIFTSLSRGTAAIFQVAGAPGPQGVSPRVAPPIAPVGTAA